MRTSVRTSTRRCDASEIKPSTLSAENCCFAADRQPQRVAPQPIERDLRGQQFYPFAIPAELIAARSRNAFGRQRDTHRAHRMFRAAAAGSRNARGRDCDVRARPLDRSRSHLAHALLAHGANALERLLAHAEEVYLHRVGIGDEAALEVTRAARDVGDAMA